MQFVWKHQCTQKRGLWIWWEKTSRWLAWRRKMERTRRDGNRQSAVATSNGNSWKKTVYYIKKLWKSRLVCCWSCLSLSLLFSHQNRSQICLTVVMPRVNTALGKTAFNWFAPCKWDELQRILRLECLIPLVDLNFFTSSLCSDVCDYFWWCRCFCLFVWLSVVC